MSSSYQSNLNWRKNLARRVDRATPEEIQQAVTELVTEEGRLEAILATLSDKLECEFDILSVRHALDHVVNAPTSEQQKQAVIDALNEIFGT